MPGDLDSLLNEKRIFKPSKKFIEDSNIQKWMEEHNITEYDELLKCAEKNPEWFWDDVAKELEWFKNYVKTFKWKPPHAEWFIDGKFNIVHNAVDRHVNGDKKDKIAFIWEGESGELRTLTYEQLQIQVNKFANILSIIFAPLLPKHYQF